MNEAKPPFPTHPYTHHSDGCLCNLCQEEPRDLKAAVETLRGELVAAKSLLEQREALIKMRTCGCGDIRPEVEFCCICGKCEMGCCQCVSYMEYELMAARYEQARVDLAACERKLASAENAAKYWEEKAKGCDSRD